MEVVHPLIEGGLCLECKVSEGVCGGQQRCSSELCSSSQRTTSQKRCSAMTTTVTSPTAPSAAMGWKSFCVGTTAAAGPHLHLCPPTNRKLFSNPLFLGFRSYCRDCLNILVGAGTFESLKDLDPWICYLCQPQQPHGALVPRADWSIRVQELFANNSGMAFVRRDFIWL